MTRATNYIIEKMTKRQVNFFYTEITILLGQPLATNILMVIAFRNGRIYPIYRISVK